MPDENNLHFNAIGEGTTAKEAYDDFMAVIEAFRPISLMKWPNFILIFPTTSLHFLPITPCNSTRFCRGI